MASAQEESCGDRETTCENDEQSESVLASLCGFSQSNALETFSCPKSEGTSDLTTGPKEKSSRSGGWGNESVLETLTHEVRDVSSSQKATKCCCLKA